MKSEGHLCVVEILEILVEDGLDVRMSVNHNGGTNWHTLRASTSFSCSLSVECGKIGQNNDMRNTSIQSSSSIFMPFHKIHAPRN